MLWARFEIISGMVDVLLILSAVVLMVQVRILRKSVRRLKVPHPETFEGLQTTPSSRVPAVAPPGSTGMDEGLEVERRRLETLVREAEQLRSELSILFYDVQRFLDDLTPISRGPSPGDSGVQEEAGRMYPLPDEEEIPGSGGLPNSKESMKETVLRLSREGRSVPEIASAIGRGEGEVAFLLSMERVGRT